jgi:surface protein
MGVSKTIKNMFCHASSFTSDLSVWQTGQLTDMSGMFWLLCVVCSVQVIERAAELDIYLPRVLVKMVSECLFGKIPSDWDPYF